MKPRYFEGTALYSITKRKRSVHIKANSIEEAKEQLLIDGYLEPINIEAVPLEVPSERQLEYARGVGISFPDDIDGYDLSALLSRYEKNDKYDPDPGLVDFADARNIEYSPYIGKKSMYNKVFDALELRDKIAFFTFCVYRYLSDDRHSNLDTSPLKEKFYSFADSQLKNSSFINSMNKYTGESLRYFGKMVIENEGDWETEVYGGSTTTIAYKQTAEYLSSEFGLSKTKTARLPAQKTSTPNDQPRSYAHSSTHHYSDHRASSNDTDDIQSTHRYGKKVNWIGIAILIILCVILIKVLMS
ncbi:hypothetical protein J41TS12_39540 [Paenibacillus antibioticophila]|uniref:Uncharacterized protein n=1 Tax=Paenibacillus antibioticophila TaxID=1274374 RepID=A0A919XYW9_9BACL|nr:hypothetical protein [Paenibacillus antibioticophila]GIO39093.1 hypothetical protein J41TS12_39540 [Paenibacillus antibioticophila]